MVAELVFVYGTLKRGGKLHSYLQGARYQGKATLKGYALYKISWYPGIVPEEGASVCGELYQVNQRLLESLDQLEGREYQRTLVSVTTRDGLSLSAWAYVYLGPVTKSSKVKSGHWPV
ncbi:gamma-glutamylcyclotransferase family protein [Thermosulfuriphilus sp.]